MVASALFRRVPFAVVISLTAAFVGGSQVLGGELPGLVGELADLADTRVLVAAEEPAISRLQPVVVGVSVPVRNQSALNRDREIFQMFRSAMPLLVADLEPRVVAVARPMSGRSVGTLPVSAGTHRRVDLVRSMTIPPRGDSR
jgi:hypothetical protein